MVKNALKKSVSVLFCVAILASFLMVSPAKAYSYNTVQLERNMSRQKCWEEAGKYLYTGLSRERIAVEMFGLSRAGLSLDRAARYTAYAVCIGSYAGAGVASIVTEGTGTPAALTAASTICKTSLKAAAGIELVVDLGNVFGDNNSRTITLGEASEKRLNACYELWYKDTEKTSVYIYSALDNNDNMVLDVNGNSNKNGTKIQLWSKNKSGAQQFYILSIDDQWCNIFKTGTLKCLDVTGGKREQGVKVQLWGYNGTEAQDWQRIPVDGKPGYYYLKNRLGYYLDVCGGENAKGTQIWTWTLNETSAQQWKIP